MPRFNAINNVSEINLGNKWVSATKFNSKNRLVDETGNQVGSNYQGRQYRLIEKRERTYSGLERFARGLLGTAAVIGTLCLGLFSKSIRNLFTKTKESIRFAVLEPAVKPKPLFGGTEISEERELNFVLAEENGTQKLVPVTNKPYKNHYTTYEGTALEALLKIAQGTPRFSGLNCHYGSPIGYLLKHPSNSIISEEEFFKFILENDESGTRRICTLNADSTLEVLNILKERNIPVDLKEKTPKGESLFTLWAGKGRAAITKLMLELDPSVIDHTEKSPFVEAVLKGFQEEADLLLNAMEDRNIALSIEEIWIKKAIKNDVAFSEDEFSTLDQELKLRIYFAANAFRNEDFVRKLKTLGMETAPVTWPGPDLFAHNMDIVTARSVMENFLKGLRQDGLLLTAEEFAQLDKSTYFKKCDQIGRIQGKNFIEKLVAENGLKRIKVPKKIAVISKGLDSVSFRIDRNLELIPMNNQLMIYAERVKRVNRMLSLEEAIEFMIILEKTGYNDFCGDNFFIAEDGIYFIDTEFTNFDPTQPVFNGIQSIQNLLDPKDVEAFLVEFQKRKEAFDQEQGAREAQVKAYREAFANPFSLLTEGYRSHKFEFTLDSFTNT